MLLSLKRECIRYTLIIDAIVSLYSTNFLEILRLYVVEIGREWEDGSPDGKQLVRPWTLWHQKC